jgi:hypothetical protein
MDEAAKNALQKYSIFIGLSTQKIKQEIEKPIFNKKKHPIIQMPLK